MDAALSPHPLTPINLSLTPSHPSHPTLLTPLSSPLLPLLSSYPPLSAGGQAVVDAALSPHPLTPLLTPLLTLLSSYLPPLSAGGQAVVDAALSEGRLPTIPQRHAYSSPSSSSFR